MSSHKENKALMALISIMSIRMLGLFMILPVFAVYAEHMPGATATLVGVALGIYGLTQALLQIPCGMLSDRIGRKPVIVMGLLLLLLGSIIAAKAHSIDMLIVGRALQGTGAIGSTVLALLADLTRDESRSKAMAFMGLSIGFAFTAAMVLGPLLNSWVHLSGIFWITAILACAGIFVITMLVPKAPKPVGAESNDSIKKRLGIALKNKQLLRLDWGIFSLHTILTAMFLAIPLILAHEIKLSEWGQIALYLGVLVGAFILALPLIIIAERKRQMKPIFMAAVATITLVQIALSLFHQNIAITGILLLIFFTAFTLLEATLPSLVSKIAPVRHKGSAMGIYSSSQFFGIFVGGSLGGFVLAHSPLPDVFLFCALFGVLWFTVAVFMHQPPYLSTLVLPLNNKTGSNELYEKLAILPGVAEVAQVSEECLLYLKIDKKKISENELRKVIRAGNLTTDS